MLSWPRIELLIYEVNFLQSLIRIESDEEQESQQLKTLDRFPIAKQYTDDSKKDRDLGCKKRVSVIKAPSKVLKKSLEQYKARKTKTSNTSSKPDLKIKNFDKALKKDESKAIEKGGKAVKSSYHAMYKSNSARDKKPSYKSKY